MGEHAVGTGDGDGAGAFGHAAGRDWAARVVAGADHVAIFAAIFDIEGLQLPADAGPLFETAGASTARRSASTGEPEAEAEAEAEGEVGEDEAAEALAAAAVLAAAAGHPPRGLPAAVRVWAERHPLTPLPGVCGRAAAVAGAAAAHPALVRRAAEDEGDGDAAWRAASTALVAALRAAERDRGAGTGGRWATDAGTGGRWATDVD